MSALSALLAVSFADQYNVSDAAGLFYMAGPYDITSIDVDFTLTNLNVTEVDLTDRLSTSLAPDSLILTIGNRPFNVTFQSVENISGFVIDFDTSIPVGGAAIFTLGDNNKVVAGDHCNMTIDLAGSIINLCDDIAPYMDTAYQKAQVMTLPPTPANTTRVGDSHLVRALINMAKALDGRIPFQVRFETPSDSILRLEATVNRQVAHRLNMSFTALLDKVNEWLNGFYEVVPTSAHDFVDNVTRRLRSLNITNTPVDGIIDAALNIPRDTKMTVDVMLSDFQCDTTGLKCSVPQNGGVKVVGMNISSSVDVGMFAVMSQIAQPVVNKMLTAVLSSICSGTDNRCTIAAPHPQLVLVPPLGLLIGLPIGCVVLTTLLVIPGVLRYKRKPVLRVSGEPLPLHRVVLEDALFCFFVAVTASLFIFSNVTTAASVRVGGEITMYEFSLSTSVRGMWTSGLRPLSVLVLVFSGIYPYVKLLCMLFFTVGVQRPDSAVLRSVDIIGKFSFLDTFIMLIMIAGMSVDGIGDVQMLPSFFLFLAATICSIVAGNYATHLWRRGTDIRKVCHIHPSGADEIRKLSSTAEEECPCAVEPITSSASTPQMTSAKPLSVNEHATVHESRALCMLRRVWWRVALPSSAVIIATTVPLFTTACLSFDFGGVAGVLLSDDRRFSAYRIAMKAHWICAVVCIFTILVAPVLSALFYQPLVFLVSWTAADVFVLSCISGLVQINRFVQFTLGGNYDALYNVHVHLHWPLFTLIIAAVVTWILYIAHVLDLRMRLCRFVYRHRSRADGV